MGLSRATPDASLVNNALFTDIDLWTYHLEGNSAFDSNIEDISTFSPVSPDYDNFPCPWQDFQTPASYYTGSWGLAPAFRSETERGENHQLQPLDCLMKIEDFSEPHDTNISRSVESKQRKPSNTAYECDWRGCLATAFDNVEGWKLHIKEHAQTARNSWKPPEPCQWQGCPSKARHKTAKLFEDHLNNIHINPLLCTVEGCRHRTPFRGKADLQRHINCVHLEGSKAKCPFSTCISEGRDFSRKDKLIIHLREAHDTDPCPFEHCKTVLDPRNDRTSKHIAKLHGEFECALGSCKYVVSSFCDNGLLEHLQLDHRMDWEMVLKARDMTKAAGDKTLRNVMGAEAYACRTCHATRN